MTVKLAVLISGGGTSLQNFIDKIANGNLDAEISVVVASRRKIKGVERAEAAGLPVEVVLRRDFDDEQAFSDEVTKAIERHDVDLIVLAGFLSKWLFPPRWAGRVLNIHPGLLPEYGGQGMWGHHVHEAVLAAGEKESGCTVIIADHEYDHGPSVLERRVPVLPGDTPDTLAARIFEAECEAYPEAVRMFAEGRLPALR
ncbi:MAG: phosphoribosylglycinamide formyltransferase [Dehalococcoidia bacterium]